MSTCCICLTEVETILSCLCKATICQECFINNVKTSIGDHKLAKCVCGEDYDLNTVSSIAEKLSEEYNKIVIEKSLTNLYSCGNCLEICDVAEYEKDVYFCYSCKTNTCFKCKKAPHDGSCTKDQDEQATLDYVITCCKNEFIRGDACNLVKCPTCRKGYCWICKAKNVTHNHFVNFSPKNGKACLLFGERDQIIENPEEGMQNVLQQAPIAAPVPRNRAPAAKPAKKLCKHTCADKRACKHDCCKRGLENNVIRNRLLEEQPPAFHGYAYASTSHNGQTISTSFTF
jgi:hypothetical protein